MGAPETIFVRRKEIFKWLGITWYNLDQCVKAGLIHPVKLPGAVYHKYLTREISRVFNKGGKHEEVMGADKSKVAKRK